MRYTKEINGLKIKQTNRKMELIIILATLAIIYIIVSLFKVYESIEFQYSVVRFIRIINGLIATISIAVGLNLYKKTKELSIYILLLVYISFAITVIFGQIDYATFLNYSFNVTNYLTITVSLLRVVILSSIIIPNSTIYKIIEKNRGKSLIFVITYSIFAWIIEKQLFVGGIFENKKTLIIYTIFLNISYLVIAIKLLLKSINKNRVILNAFSISLLIVAIKLLYITMVFKYNSFNMKLISALLTYLTFFVVVVGSVIELYLINGKVEHLNNELIKFYNLAHFNSYNYMFICDRNLNISYMNNKIKEHYGQDIDEKWYKEKILKNDGFKEKINEIQEELTKNGAWRGLVNVSNNKCIFDCYIQMIYSSENKSFNENEILVSFISITDRIKLEQELEVRKLNDTKKSEFISTLSHELKTPLNVLYSTLQLLERTKSNGADEFLKVYDKYSSSLKLNSKRMIRLINNIVDTTKIDTGIISPNFGNYEIVSFIENIVISTVSFLKFKNITIEFDTNVEEHYIKCDPNMIEKVVLNLLSNSIKYTEHSGRIKVNINVSEKNVVLTFEDNGIGIPIDMKDKVFERFLRLDNSFKRLNEGSGIGLSIVKSMVEAHDGFIFVSSELERGSIFDIVLPNVLVDNMPMKIYEFDEANTELELSDIYN